MSTDLNDVVAALVERTRAVEAHEHEIPALPTVYSWMSYRFSGCYHFSVPFAPATTFAVLANWIYAVPFFVPRDVTVTKIGIYKTAGVNNKHARLGIYRDGGSIYPTTLVSDCGAFTFTGAGADSVEKTGLSVALTARTLYWLAVVCDDATTFNAFANDQAWGIQGAKTIALSGTDAFGMWAKAQAYGALPDPFYAAPPGLPLTGMNPLAIGVFV